MSATELPKFSAILERFAEQAPATVLTRLLLQSEFAADFFDTLFAQYADVQYVRQLAFSSVAQLMFQVVTRQQPTIHAAYLAAKERQEIVVSINAVYDKLKNTEAVMCEQIVGQSAARLVPLHRLLAAVGVEPVRGYRLRTIDGNHFGPTEHRLKVLRNRREAARPGQALAIHDHATDMISELIGCEDAHANERTMLGEVVQRLGNRDLVMGDRNFCTQEFLDSIHHLGAKYLIRRHGTMPYEAIGRRRRVGKCSTGIVFEQEVMISWDGRRHLARAVTIVRSTPLRSSRSRRRQKPESTQYDLTLLTNLSASQLSGVRAAELYKKRWTIEEAFRKLTEELRCEVNSLGYPKAALLAFSLAVVAYNTTITVRACLAAVHGSEEAKTISFYHLTEEIRRTMAGLNIAVSAAEWQQFDRLSTRQMAQLITRIARRINPQRYPLKKRGPKKPKPPHRPMKGFHLATARLLVEAKI